MFRCPNCGYVGGVPPNDGGYGVTGEMVAALVKERGGVLRALRGRCGCVPAVVVDVSGRVGTLRLVGRGAYDALPLEPGDALGCVLGGKVSYVGTVLDVCGDVVTLLLDSPVLEGVGVGHVVGVVDYEFLLSYDIQLSLLSELLAGRVEGGVVGSGFTRVKVNVFNDYPLKLFTGEARQGKLKYSNPSSPLDVRDGFRLDDSQLRAVSAALGLEEGELLLIVGPPGTGKTRVIAKIAYELALRGEKVLVTSHTNRAVDNAIELLPLNTTLRVGRPEKVLGNIRPYLLSYKYRTKLGEELRNLDKEIGKYVTALRGISKGLKYRDATAKQMLRDRMDAWKARLSKLLERRAELIRRASSEVIKEVRIIGSTLIKSQLQPLRDVAFDTVVVDEASQASISLALLAMVKARKWVVVGDHNQLPPVFRYCKSVNTEALSAFKTLLRNYPQRHLWLTTHYRSNPTIIGFPAKHVYGGKIRPHESCFRKKLRLSSKPSIEALTPEKPVVFIHVRSKDESLRDKLGYTKANRVEAEVVKRLILDLLRCGVPRDAIGVITPYRAQRALIQNLLKGISAQNIEVNTVDAFQGREKDVIIYDVVSTGNMSFPSNKDRLNVALTRARLKLIVVGNGKAITNAEDAGLLLEFIKYCLELGSIYDWDKKEWIRRRKQRT